MCAFSEKVEFLKIAYVLRTFFKERKINNRCFDFLSQQGIIVPLILDINGEYQCMKCKRINKIYKRTFVDFVTARKQHNLVALIQANIHSFNNVFSFSDDVHINHNKPKYQYRVTLVAMSLLIVD